MKTAFLLYILAAPAFAATAYDSLGALGKQRGDGTLDRVTEVRGTGGAPQPRSWFIVTQDKEARGGVREFEMQGSKIAGERTPAGRALGTTMNMSKLNLDSDGAHTVAEKEAKKSGFAYDHADYALRAGTHGGSPVWEVRLVDERSGDVGTLTIAADSGNLLTADGLKKSGDRTAPPTPAVANNTERVERPVASDNIKPKAWNDPRPQSTGRSPSEGFQRAGDKVSNFFERAGTHMNMRFHQLGDKIHNKVTGDNRDSTSRFRTPEEEEDAPEPAPAPAPQPQPKPKSQPQPQPRTYHDANGTEYYRPRD